MTPPHGAVLAPLKETAIAVEPMPVAITPVSLDRFQGILDVEEMEGLRALQAHARDRLGGRVLWNVNSTAQGGGVVEMLRPLLAYVRGAGVDTRWKVIGGDAAFFHVTKRIHNLLHGMPGDGLELGAAARSHYEAVLDANLAALGPLVRPDDAVILHDPQTAGLVPGLRARGAHVVWRCHVGLDTPNDLARGAWRFLLPYVAEADAVVFTRPSFVWEGLDAGRVSIIAPSIDPFSAKNCELDGPTVNAILDAAGLVPGESAAPPLFARFDGSPARVDRIARIVEDAPIPPTVPLVVQVSRWDHTKDPLGVMLGFAHHVAPHTDAHLVLAGPDVEAVADDPEGADVLHEVIRRREELPDAMRRAVHLASLPMADEQENAAIVNALQRRADVVVQKSLAEGFGLTVAEAMWKGRPVVASRVGGIQDQIVDGVSGVLLDDPSVLTSYGEAVLRLLEDHVAAQEIGHAAHLRVRANFIAPRHLAQYMALLDVLDTT
jgi:trehalose synthase